MPKSSSPASPEQRRTKLLATVKNPCKHKAILRCPKVRSPIIQKTGLTHPGGDSLNLSPPCLVLASPWTKPGTGLNHITISFVAVNHWRQRCLHLTSTLVNVP